MPGMSSVEEEEEGKRRIGERVGEKSRNVHGQGRSHKASSLPEEIETVNGDVRFLRDVPTGELPLFK